MKKHSLSIVLALALTILTGWGIHLDVARQVKAIPLGGTVNTRFVGTLPTTLSGAGITTSAVSISVTSLTLKQTAQPLSMADFGTVGYVTLEPGSSARQEFASFTGITQNSNGTAVLTGVTRGLAPIYPYTASSSMQFTHGGGTTLIVSNSPPFYDNFVIKNNDQDISGLLTFDTILPTSNLIATSSNQLITKQYADGLTFAGTATATQSVTGISRLATALQVASSTPSTSNTPLVMQAQNATDTPVKGCAVGYTGTAGAGCSVIALLTGKIKQTWLDIFSTANTWTNQNTFNASTTITATSTLATTTITTGGLSIGRTIGATTTNNLLVQGNASTSYMTISNACSGCVGSSTAYEIVNAGVAGPTTIGGVVSTSVSCSSGKIVIGGGATSTVTGSDLVYLTKSYPSNQTTWTTEFVGGANVGASTIGAYAICEKP